MRGVMLALLVFGSVGAGAAQDTDDDGIPDVRDNCIETKNAAQIDADSDGYGNACDADFTNDGKVNFADLAYLKSKFNSNDPVADLNGNGFVNFADLAITKRLWLKPPGPSYVDQDSDEDGVLDGDDKWPNDASRPVLSPLWGAYGEDWQINGRLPFVAMAGHNDGKDVEVSNIVANVKDFYDGESSGSAADTQAFLAAIDHAADQVSADNPGVIEVPAGIYEIDQPLHLANSGLILRGAGMNNTEIRFAGAHRGVVMGGRRQANGSYKGGLNWQHDFNTKSHSACLEKSNLPARGEFILHLDAAMSAKFKSNLAKQNGRVRVAQWLNRANGGETPALLNQVYGGPLLEPAATGNTFVRQEFIATIVDDYTLQMDRPLRFSPTPETRYNQPACVSLRALADWESEQIGLESLTLRYVSESYDASQFIGHNGVGKEGVEVYSSHSWVKDVKVINADNALVTDPSTSHVSFINVELEADRKTATYGPGIPFWYQVSGHIGVALYGNDHLLNGFQLHTSYIHDISMKDSQGCVMTNGSGAQINMDSHRQLVYSNVWTDIDLGNAHRMWDSTGDATEGFQSAALNTWWNIRSQDTNVEEEKPVWPADGNWIRGTENWGYYKQNYVAVKGLVEKPQPGSYLASEPYYDPADIHLEATDVSEIWPDNIYEAQRKALKLNKLW